MTPFEVVVVTISYAIAALIFKWLDIEIEYGRTLRQQRGEVLA